MSERVEAAAEVISEVDYPDYLPDLQLARRVLDAADQIMFSDEAVDRAAFVLYKDDQWGKPTKWPEGPFADDLTLEEVKSEYVKLARDVIAAVTGKSPVQ